MSGSDRTRDGDDEYSDHQEFETDRVDTPDDDDDFVDEDELNLGQRDEPLPWLEGDGDDDDFESYNTSQLLGYVVIGLLLLGIVLGGIWWASRGKGSEGTLVADGSTIEAPAEPYKQRPDDPGGKTFEGTGDTSFAVSQGETRQAQVGSGRAGAAASSAASEAKPGFAVTPTTAPSAMASAKAPVPAATAAQAETGGVGVQVGAFSSRAAAEKAWSTLTGRHKALSGMRYRIVEGQADFGTAYRLQAVAADGRAARSLCSALKASSLACQVKD